MNEPRWIIVPNWFGDDGEGLQHYRDRDPVWIKNYRRLLARDEYRDLSGHCRAILHGLWLEYASSDGRLRLDSHSLSSRLALRVTMKHLETLNHAGFIEFSASKPLALCEQRASPRALAAETEEETETQEQPLSSNASLPKPAKPAETRPPAERNGISDFEPLATALAAAGLAGIEYKEPEPA